MRINIPELVEKSLKSIEDLNMENFSLDENEDIIEHFDIDSMGTMIFIANLEEAFSKKINYDYLSQENFKLSIKTITKAFNIDKIDE